MQPVQINEIKINKLSQDSIVIRNEFKCYVIRIANMHTHVEYKYILPSNQVHTMETILFTLTHTNVALRNTFSRYIVANPNIDPGDAIFSAPTPTLTLIPTPIQVLQVVPTAPQITIPPHKSSPPKMAIDAPFWLNLPQPSNESRRGRASKPKPHDMLFWCYYLFRYGLTAYTMTTMRIGDMLETESREKSSIIHDICENKPMRARVKTIALVSLKTLESGLSPCEIITPRVFFTICVLFDIFPGVIYTNDMRVWTDCESKVKHSKNNCTNNNPQSDGFVCMQFRLNAPTEVDPAPTHTEVDPAPDVTHCILINRAGSIRIIDLNILAERDIYTRASCRRTAFICRAMRGKE